MLRSLGDLLHRIPFLARLRRNHALEHATIHVLSQRQRKLKVVGRSTNTGIFLYGPLETAEVEAAVHEALARLRRGEHQLAVHPNCGTSLLTAGVMTGLASFFAMLGTRRLLDRLGRLPMTIFFTTAALVLAQPLGLNLQRTVTTEPDVGDLRVKSVKRLASTPITVHWIETIS
jgi:hypothetical protein